MTRAQMERMYMMRRYGWGLNPLNAVYYIPGVGHAMDAGYEAYKKARRLGPGARAGFQQGGTWGEHRRVENYLKRGRSDRAANFLLPGLGFVSGGLSAMFREEFVPRNKKERELMERAIARDMSNQLITPKIAKKNLHSW